MQLSIVVPVFNRPFEIRELLESLARQTDAGFDVVIVDDGSTETCESEVASYISKLDVRYMHRPNSGPGFARNAGSELAKGDYLIFLDSDCMLPPQYIATVRRALALDYTDAFGGPDRARQDFTPLQRAINYSMTSFFTTGGIRGGSERLDKFHPRSFNMGYSKTVYSHTGGFSSLRFGEDIDMSIRIISAGFSTRLIRGAYVYHRRRTTLMRFFKQVFNSGIARINLYKRHPHSLKPVHLAPAVFTLGVGFVLLLCIFVTPKLLFLLLSYAILIFIDASYRNKSLPIGLLAVATSHVQLLGYGSGFLYAAFARLVLKKEEFSAFQTSFYQ